jgi:ABC-2 type transport system permease protein
VALLALWMLQDKGPDYRIFIVVGSGMSGLWSSLLFISGNSVNTERWMGTLETLVGVPTPLPVIVIGKNLASVVQSLVSMAGCYVLASLIFGYPLSVSWPFLFFVSLAVTVAALICFGLVIASLFVLNPAVQQLQNGLEFPVFLLSGFLFPIAMLPQWSAPISYLLPPYWAARALHTAARASAPVGDIFFSWLMLAVTAALYLLLSMWMFVALVNKARRDATLDMF